MGTEYWIIGILVFLVIVLTINTFYTWDQLRIANDAWDRKCDAFREMKGQRDLYRNESRILKEMMAQYDKEIARLKVEIVELQNPPDTTQELAEKNVKRPRCLIRPPEALPAKTTAQVMDEDS